MRGRAVEPVLAETWHDQQRDITLRRQGLDLPASPALKVDLKVLVRQ